MFLADDVLAHLSAVTDAPDLDGTKYRIVRVLGRGGMGVVYAAEDPELEREVAIKVTRAAPEVDSALAERLKREAQVIARLEHPGIVPVHDVGTLPDGRVYYVMKLVRGERLDSWSSRHGERGAPLRLFQRICEAVAFAHARGVLHRDLKPENVMVGEFGEALVMDWGIAKVLADRSPDGAATTDADAPLDGLAATVRATDVGATAPGTVMGTPAYMPPEQARGDIGALDARSDVYGLGAILYTLLLRRPPFSEIEGPGALKRIADSTPPRVRSVDASVPRALGAICEKAMAKAPSDRYASALDLADDVARFLDGERVRAYGESALERGVRFASRNRVVLSLFAAYLIVRAILIALARA